MKVLGLCGGSGAGKGVVCQTFEKYGIPSIDTDAVYHRLTEKKSECLTKLTEQFGRQILTSAQTLDRKELSKIVFADEEKRLKLNQIAHYYIKAETQKEINRAKEQGKNAVIIDAPLLFESGFNTLCDQTIVVCAPTELRLQRIMTRDGLSEEQAKARLCHQLGEDELISKCDFVVVNDGKTDLDVQVQKILKEI